MKIQYLQYGGNYNNKYSAKKKKGKLAKVLKILLILFVIFALILTFVFIKFGFKNTINKGFEILNSTFSPVSNKITLFFNEIKGLNNIYYGLDEDKANTFHYINNAIRDNISINAITQSNDVKSIIETETFDRLVNYTDGYYLSMPKKLNYNFSLSPIFIKGTDENYDITISMERSPYADVWEYIDYYQNRFFLNDNYQKTNNITIHENKKGTTNGYDFQIISLTRNTDLDVISFNTYTYIYIKLSGQEYIRFMVKTKEYNDEHINTCTNMINSFTQIQKKFTQQYSIEYYPIENTNWNNDTKELYEKYIASKDISWGIFAADIASKGINETIPSIEKELDYSFDVILMYNHLGNALPLDAMKKASKDGKVIELTVQTCYANNTKLFDETPMFNILEGKLDKEIRTLAKEIKSLNTSILFRLNNEMNTDWTSYCGMANLCDPDVYIKVWQKIYNIFEEENVNNCIWIYNPNDNNYPPSNWNNFLAYYPGNQYVQMIGITGYNTGTYYNSITGETWKEFEYIYDEINNKYQNHFSGFSWIITEFASSSVGGDKPQWIKNMFNVIGKYKNIKVAVWFSAADYDENGNVARPYWLDENKECLEAFKNGIKKID